MVEFSQILVFWTPKKFFATHFFVAICAVCPVAIPEPFAHSRGNRLLPTHSFFWEGLGLLHLYIERVSGIVNCEKEQSRFLGIKASWSFTTRTLSWICWSKGAIRDKVVWTGVTLATFDEFKISKFFNSFLSQMTAPVELLNGSIVDNKFGRTSLITKITSKLTNILSQAKRVSLRSRKGKS